MSMRSTGGGTPQMMSGQPQQYGASTQMQQPQNVWQQSAGAYNSALSGTQAAMNSAQSYQPAQVQAQNASAKSYSAAQADPARQFAGMDMNPYMNSYTSQVIDQNAQDMDRARLIEQNQTNDAMMNAGAFGGSRHGVANAETNRGFYDRLGAMSGQLRDQGFQNAQNAAFQDIGNYQQNSQFNVGQDNAARAQKADLATKASMSNSAQNNAVNMANAANAMQAQQMGFNSQLSAAGQMSGLAGQGFGFGSAIADRQMNDGAITQGMQQGIIDAGKSQFGQFSNAGNLGLGNLGQFIGGKYGSTTTESRTPGLFDFAGLLP